MAFAMVRGLRAGCGPLADEREYAGVGARRRRRGRERAIYPRRAKSSAFSGRL